MIDRRRAALAALGRAALVDGTQVDEALATTAVAEQVAPLLGARIQRGVVTASGRARTLLVGAYLAERTRADQRATATAPLLAALAAADIPVMLLKGAALAHGIYAPGERVMADVDWLVPEGRFHDAQAALMRGGATPRHARALLARLGLGHEQTFVTADGAHVDLHARLYPWPLWPIDAATLWRSACDVGAGVRIPAPADLFVSLALHAAQDAFVLVGRHVVDGLVMAVRPALTVDAVVAVATAWRARRPLAVWLRMLLALGGDTRWAQAVHALDPNGSTVALATHVPFALDDAMNDGRSRQRAKMALVLGHDTPLRPLAFLAYRGLLRAGDWLSDAFT